MPVRLSEKFIAYLALFSGLTISVVAEYYSILGLTAIFSAAVIPVIIMGIALGIGKITATVWLKQNWEIAPWSVRIYLGIAILVLMLITSMGIFGFLSKAHSDQSLITGDAQAKLLIYDEKIKTAKENIEANRRQLKQMDEAVDQVMARSTSEEGATKANNIRRSQQRDRVALAKDIETNQKLIAALNEESAPLRAEVRKVEAEVGPIKYIAAFVYGETDKTILEKAVTWVIIVLIVVFDPLAVILLLASQISFQSFRDREQWNFERDLEEAADAFNDVFADELANTKKTPGELMGLKPDAWVADVGEKPTKEELEDLFDDPEVKGFFEKGRAVAKALDAGEPLPEFTKNDTTTETVEENFQDKHPYLYKGDFWKKPEGWISVGPLVAKSETVEDTTSTVVAESTPVYPERPTFDFESLPADVEYVKIDGQMMHIRAAKSIYNQAPKLSEGYIQNEEQSESGVWGKVISEAEYREQAQAKLQNDGKNNSNNTA